eukprot:3233617-Prymnesium_polylepis.1
MGIYSQDTVLRSTVPAALTVHHKATCAHQSPTVHAEMLLVAEGGLDVSGDASIRGTLTAPALAKVAYDLDVINP